MRPPFESSPAGSLTASAKSIFRLLAEGDPSTRPQLGEALNLSRPTMSAAIAELEQLGLVAKIGEVQGLIGRKAAIYRPGPTAGHVIAIDAGSTHVRLRVSTIDRRLLHSRVYRLPASQLLLGEEISRAVAEEVAATLTETDPGWGPLRMIGIAVPSRVVGPQGDRSATRQEEIFSCFEPPANVPVVLENNVNCAAVAERSYGIAKDSETFAYVQIGLKIGMGLMLGGRLLRGRNGAAGEIGHLAFPMADGSKPIAGEIERYMGTEGFMQRVVAAWPEPSGKAPADAADLMARAGEGCATALAHVTRHAEDIGAIVASCVSVADPGLVVLGGGMGGSPLLMPTVSEVANRLSYPVEVRTSTLGQDATVLGIEKLACEQTVDLLLGESRD
ncbi:ROK family transcriptional regulator [Neoaquamicrobium microcysteis]|uniref:ROK family transcriptional regulator n=1 Tax=Neoaquamicrobium microcysteis TaxID=2682781 RepID=UPI001F1D712D|nr:ROK family transcriptional regulator [Mesorhizobium microcysteis]